MYLCWKLSDIPRVATFQPSRVASDEHVTTFFYFVFIQYRFLSSLSQVAQELKGKVGKQWVCQVVLFFCFSASPVSSSYIFFSLSRESRRTPSKRKSRNCFKRKYKKILEPKSSGIPIPNDDTISHTTITAYMFWTGNE